MFSDESHFELKFSRQTRCRRPVGSDRHDPKFTRKTLVESMPRRLEAVIENGGNATKY